MKKDVVGMRRAPLDARDDIKEEPIFVCQQCGQEITVELIATFAKGPCVGEPACYEVYMHKCRGEYP